MMNFSKQASRYFAQFAGDISDDEPLLDGDYVGVYEYTDASGTFLIENLSDLLFTLGETLDYDERQRLIVGLTRLSPSEYDLYFGGDDEH